MLCIIRLSFIMLTVIMLTVIMLSVIMLRFAILLSFANPLVILKKDCMMTVNILTV